MKTGVALWGPYYLQEKHKRVIRLDKFVFLTSQNWTFNDHLDHR